MDILTVTGLLVGLAAVIVGSILKGSGAAALLNGAAFVIVMVGTVAAVLVQVRMPVFLHALKIVRWVFVSPHADSEQTLQKVLQWSQVSRREGLLGLETISEEEPDDFIRKGLQLLVDGAEPEAIRNIMEVELQSREHFDQQGAKVYESLGIYAPTLGIVGAVLGLMAVMQNLAQPELLGQGIAAAFVATVYGIGSANLVFLPIGNKLKSIVAHSVSQRELVIDGLVAIARGDNPRNIESRLRGYLH
jgi:chemotaxis protein MotA